MTRRYPFKFLDAYNQADTDIFFGRDEEVEALYQMTFQSDILLVYGASGTGKTSLINCGLAGRFQAHDWLALNIRRGSDLNLSLQQKLEEATAGVKAADSDLDLSWLDEDEAVDEAVPPLSRQLTAIYRQYFRPVYLIFDQLEELYVLGSKAEQAAFIRNIQEIQSVDQPVKMIFVIREEYLGHLFEFERAVPQLLRKKLRVEPMNLDKVGQVVRGAAALDRSNVRLEAGQEAAIVEGIFEKIRGSEQTLAIQLPYLQVFLDKLYLQVTGDEARQAEALFTPQALAEIGDIGDVLRDFLEEQAVRIQKALAGQYPGLPEDAVWQILSPLATLEGTKEPLLEETLLQRLAHLPPAAVRDGLQALDQRRILRYDEQEGRYEVAHDSLAARIAEHRNDDEIALLEIRRLISSQMALKAEARALFTEKQLNLIDPYLDKLSLEPEAVQLIEESRHELAAQTRRRRRRNLTIGGVLGVASIVAIFFAIRAESALAGLQQRTAQISDNFLVAADKDILNLDYEAALQKIKSAGNLEVDNQNVGKALMEIIYFFNETGRQQRAVDLTNDLSQLLGHNRLSLARDTLISIRNYLKKVDAGRYAILKNRYFPEMIKVPGGSFNVGRFAGMKVDSFRMARYETTNWQYHLFCLKTGQDSIERTREGWPLQGHLPVVNISWEDALRYANWLSRCEELEVAYSYDDSTAKWDTTSTGYRLPTVMEWEYAARSGIRQDTFNYSGSDTLELVGWYANNSNNRPHEVGMKNGNKLELFDMSGNVWELCWDRRNPYSNKALRGGSWNDFWVHAMISNYSPPRSYRLSSLGFRVVSSL